MILLFNMTKLWKMTNVIIMYLSLDAFSFDELGRTIVVDVTGAGLAYNGGAGTEAIEEGDLLGLFLLLGHIELLCTD